MDLERLAARFVLREVHPEELPDVAVQALLDGAEAPSFAVLAGEPRSASPDELRELLAAALDESAVRLPDVVAAAHVMKRVHAQQVASGAVAPLTGARRIIGLYRRVDHHFPAPSAEYGDSFGIARLCGLEDDWGGGYADDAAIEAEIREECARIAAEQDSAWFGRTTTTSG